MHLVSQHYMLMAARDAMNAYKKRMDFDFLGALEKFERIVLETDITKFN
jgi:hypothetical protein